MPNDMYWWCERKEVKEYFLTSHLLDSVLFNARIIDRYENQRNMETSIPRK